MVNDTLHVTQNFELGLSEYRGKITGYTYQTYIINDTFYYSIKKVKAERKDGYLVIEDVERIGDNFPERAARKVRMTAKFPLINDSTIDFLKGHWNTNQTKVYYSVGGDIQLKEQEEDKESDLMAHLQEMNVKTDLAVKQSNKSKEEDIAKNKEPLKNQNKPSIKVPKNTTDRNPVEENKKEVTGTNSMTGKGTTVIVNDPQNNTTAVKKENDLKSSVASSNKSSIEIKSNETVVNNTKPVDQRPEVFNKAIQQNNSNGQNQPNEKKSVGTVSANKTTVQPSVNKQATQKAASQTMVNNDSIAKKTITGVAVNNSATQPKSIIQKTFSLPSIVAERKNENMQDIYFKNDSLVLSLYDNGIVDGDTVSVFVNGENIISRQKLKEAATKKTVYISSTTDSVQLVLFAENLGSIPPNTGLLTVRDGDDVYQVRFSADLQKNASIILRRRKD
jgi:hypothetical protein